MAFQWNASYAVGVPAIDTQHQELFTRISALLDAMREQKGQLEVGKTLRFLENYVIEHFGMEEALMSRIGYSALTAHRTQHQAFIHDFTALKAQFTAEGATSSLVIQVQRRVCDWLVQHIKQTDLLLGQYLTVHA